MFTPGAIRSDLSEFRWSFLIDFFFPPLNLFSKRDWAGLCCDTENYSGETLLP